MPSRKSFKKARRFLLPLASVFSMSGTSASRTATGLATLFWTGTGRAAALLIRAPGINQINSPEATNEVELTRKAASYPNRAAVTPPRAEPRANWRNRVEYIMTFAVSTSLGVTRLGSAAFFAPSKNTEKDDMAAPQTYTIHNSAGDRT